MGLEPLTLGQCHRRWATKAHFENIHFTDGGRGTSCPVPFKDEARHSSYLWHDWLHMTSSGRHVSLCIAIRNALLSAEKSVMPRAYNIIEALRRAEEGRRNEWRTKPWIDSEMSMALKVRIMIEWPFIVTTVLHDIWFGFACGAIWYDQKALKAWVKRSGYLATSWRNPLRPYFTDKSCVHCVITNILFYGQKHTSGMTMEWISDSSPYNITIKCYNSRYIAEVTD